jgi:hypothetical protein
MLSGRARSLLAALVLGPALGLAVPFIELAYDCRRPTSEACVWGKALLPVSIAVGIVLVGGLLAAALFALFEWRRTRKLDSD